METHSESIWRKSLSGWKTMRNARRRFREVREKDPAAAHVALASDHYSLIKRYMAWWKKPLAAWHMWRATTHDMEALCLGLKNSEQTDVVSRHLARAPGWLGGNRVVALSLLFDKLYAAPDPEAKPHTRPLMLCTLGDIFLEVGEIQRATDAYMEARTLVPTITDDRQCVRVMSEVGFFFWQYGDELEKRAAYDLVGHAIGLANRVSKDQAEKVRVKWRKIYHPSPRGEI